jgi:hypothetical protein
VFFFGMSVLYCVVGGHSGDDDILLVESSEK